MGGKEAEKYRGGYAIEKTGGGVRRRNIQEGVFHGKNEGETAKIAGVAKKWGGCDKKHKGGG